MKTKVIFRKWKDSGDIIALFPELPGTNDASTCESYEHNGGHGAANPRYIIQVSVLATPEEYADTKRELETHYEYDLEVRTKYSHSMYLARISELYRMREVAPVSM